MKIVQITTLLATAADAASAVLLAARDDGDGSLNGTRLPKPSKDPWYAAPPDGWEATAPGTVLKMRPHAYNMSATKFDGYIDVFQLLFRTSDSHDQPMFGVTTVFVPEVQAPCLNGTASATGKSATACSHALLSYHPPYDTACIDASPSYGLQFGEPYGEIALALKRGWFVSVPDYEGPQASYGANVLAGHVILDSVRAVLPTLRQYGVQALPENNATYSNVPYSNATYSNTTAHGNTTTPRVAFWGYSSGGTATDFALELADAYAPGLRLDGAAVGGMTANLTRSCELLSGRDVAGLLAQTLLGMATQYPDQRRQLDAALRPAGVYNATEFRSARNMSGWDALVHFAYQDMFSYFRHGRDDVFGSAPIRDMFAREGWAGRHGAPPRRTPSFYYQAAGDEMCPSAFVDEVVDGFCSKGARLLYHRNQVGGHNDELSNGRQRALDFLGDVLDGTQTMTGAFPADGGCSIVNVTISVDPNGPFH